MGEANRAAVSSTPAWAARSTFYRPTPDSQPVFDGETGHLRSISPEAAPSGCAASFEQAFALCTDRPCIGRRSGPQQPFEWCSYGSFVQDVRAVAASLVCQLPAGGRVGICAASSYEWIVTDFACLFAGMTSVALSNAWDPATLQAVAQQRQLAAIACDLAAASKCLEAARLIEEPRAVVLLQPVPRASPLRPAPDLVLLHFAALLCEPPLATPVVRDPSAIHTIMHTSGTTGLPKGVEYSDSLWLSNMAHFPADLCVAASYQPLAFITDRHTVATTLWNGGRVGLVNYQPDKPKMECIITDLQEIRPTVLKGVPKFWLEIQVAARMQHDVGLQVLGGRTHTLICGAGALDPSVAAWYQGLTIRGKPLAFIVGYGSTEAGNLAMNRKMLPHVEWKLLPREGFEVSQGYGELAVKTGDMMFSGYDKNAEGTSSAFTIDGFYKMGDIVQITTWPDGAAPQDASLPQKGAEVTVDVLGRTGSSIKLSTGKWVAVERLEDIFRTCVGVRHLMVHGNNQHDQLVALVDREPANQMDSEAIVLGRLRAQAQACGLNAFEYVAGVTFASRHFSQDDQTLSGTDKLNRRNLYRVYGDQLESTLSAASGNLDPFIGLSDDHSFHQQGGTSIKANEIATLYAKLGVARDEVLLKLADDDRSIGDIKKELQRQRSGADIPDVPPTEITLPAEFTLETALECRKNDTEAAEKRTVLVTGATGFIGAFAVAELLRQGWHVICAVRNAEGDAALHRVEGSLHDRGLWTAEIRQACATGRLTVIGASLSRPFFGMSATAFDEVATRCSSILHLAAKVDLHGHFEAHRSANIDGLVEVLRLGFRARARLIFASTTDVLPAGWGDDEPAPSALPALPETEGYALSKLVGERLVETAVERGLAANIVRLGFIGGSSATGVCNPKDFVCRLLIGICHSQAFPAPSGPDVQTLTRFLPVDVTTRVLVALLNLDDSPSTSGVLHLTAGGPDLPLADLHGILLRFGSPFSPLPLLPFQSWMERAELDGALSVWPVLSWAKGREHFPAFNSRSARPGRVLELLEADSPLKAELCWSRSELERTIHAMLRYLFE